MDVNSLFTLVQILFQDEIIDQDFGLETEQGTKDREPKEVKEKVQLRDFGCKLCSKTFRSRSELRYHDYTHTGEKPMLCYFCGQGFAHPSNRCVHERKIHKMRFTGRRS